MQKRTLTNIYKRLSTISITTVFAFSTIVSAAAPFFLIQTAHARIINGNNPAGIQLPNQVTQLLKPNKPVINGIYKNHDMESTLIPCGGYTNDTSITIDWNDDKENIAYYWFGTKSNQYHRKVEQSHYDGTMSAANGPVFYYTVTAVSHTGIESDISEKCYITLDQQAPSATIVSPTSETDEVNGVVTVTGMVDESEPNIKSHWFEIKYPNDSYIYSYVMNTEDMSYSFDWDTRELEDGEYRIRYVARDKAGNRSDEISPSIKTIVVDNTPPSLTVNQPSPSSEKPTISGTVDDIAAKVTVTIDDQSFTVLPSDDQNNEYTWSANITNSLSPGEHTYSVVATDTLGNTSEVQRGVLTILSPDTSDDTGNPPLNPETEASIDEDELVTPFNTTDPRVLGYANTTLDEDVIDEPKVIQGEVESATTKNLADSKENKKEIVEAASESFGWYWAFAFGALVMAVYYGYRNYRSYESKDY